MIEVVSVCEYLMSGERSQGHWAAFKFVRALKAEPFRQYAWVPVNGEQRRLTMDNRADALDWAGEMLARQLDRVFGANATIRLVPIPGSKCVTPELVRSSRVYRIAQTAATCMFSTNVDVKVLLCWSREMQSAHSEGGPRTAAQLAPHYSVAPMGNDGTRVVLIDDVLTGGGHLCAAATRMREAGYPVDDVAFVVARTCWPDDNTGRQPTNDAFSVASTVIHEANDIEWPDFNDSFDESDDWP